MWDARDFLPIAEDDGPVIVEPDDLHDLADAGVVRRDRFEKTIGSHDLPPVVSSGISRGTALARSNTDGRPRPSALLTSSCSPVTRSRGTDCLPFPADLDEWDSASPHRGCQVVRSAVLVACEELLPEDVPFHLEFIQAVLDHVADADDPAKPPMVHHRNVPSTVTRHPAHHLRDAVVRSTGDDR